MSTTPRLRSVCPHDCPSTCALSVERLNSHTIGRIYGDPDHDYTRGVICAKVARYAERIHHPERLREWLIRSGGKGGAGTFEPIHPEAALDLIAERWQRLIASEGAESIWPFHYAGTMGWVQRDGLERLRRALGTSRMHGTYCVTIADAGYIAGTGSKRGTDARGIENTDLLVIWGGNPVNTQVNVMHHYAQARRRRAARMIVIDPYRTRTAEKADLHLAPKPGTDGALACALMHVFFRDSRVNRDYVSRFARDVELLEAQVATRDPVWASAITGLSVADIEQCAEWWGNTPNSFLRLGYGFSRSRNGAVNMHAASCLPVLLGSWQQAGGGALYSQAGLYSLDKRLLCGLDIPCETRVLDQSRIGAILCAERGDAELLGGPPVRSLLVQNTNPAVVAPDSLRVREGLRRPDLFTVVHEQFMTDTAREADLLIPATMFLEHDDVYVASGHSYLQIGRRLIEPPSACISNHALLSQLASRLGLAHPAFQMSELELIDEMLSTSGLPDAESVYEQGGVDCALSPERMSFLEGFDHPDGRFHFSPDWSGQGPFATGMPELPDHWAVIDAPTAEHPLRLVTAPARQFLNSSFTETATSQKMEGGGPAAWMHAADVARYQLKDQEYGVVFNALGEVTLRVQVREGVSQGTVVVESLWPNEAFKGGIGINALISAEPAQPNGGAVYHDCSVGVRPSG